MHTHIPSVVRGSYGCGGSGHLGVVNGKKMFSGARPRSQHPWFSSTYFEALQFHNRHRQGFWVSLPTCRIVQLVGSPKNNLAMFLQNGERTTEQWQSTHEACRQWHLQFRWIAGQQERLAKKKSLQGDKKWTNQV